MVEPFPGGYASIRRIADRVRLKVTQWNPTSDVTLFLEGCVRLWGGRVEISRNLSWLEPGSLTIQPGGQSFILRLSPVTSPLRDTWAMAHDLGHFFLHYPHSSPTTEPLSFPRYGASVVESQADAFAETLLDPFRGWLKS